MESTRRGRDRGSAPVSVAHRGPILCLYHHRLIKTPRNGEFLSLQAFDSGFWEEYGGMIFDC